MEEKPSRMRKRAKHRNSQNKKFLHQKNDSAAVEEIAERQEEEEEESPAFAFAKRRKSQGLSKSPTFLDKTNFASYLKEAHRVLKPCGWLLIAEVKSRFDPNTGGADPKKLSKAVCELGFTSELKVYWTSRIRCSFYYTFKKKDKQNSNREEIEWPELKPCLYKRR